MLSAVSHPNPNQGVTLLEVIIAAVITGILAAIGTPSLMGMLQGDQVKQGIDQIQLALQDAQKQAIRNSKQCTIVIDKDADPPTVDIKDPTAATNKGCLGSVERELPKNIVVKSNLSSNEIAFSFKGNTINRGTIVVEPSQGTGEKRCLVISDGLGIMRTGIYTGDTSGSLDGDANCKKITDI